MEYNSIKPISHPKLLAEYKGLREPDERRDKNFSPLQDGIMSAICRNLKNHTDAEAFDKAWTSSLFPERATKEILRLVEQFIELNQKGRKPINR